MEKPYSECKNAGYVISKISNTYLWVEEEFIHKSRPFIFFLVSHGTCHFSQNRDLGINYDVLTYIIHNILFFSHKRFNI